MANLGDDAGKLQTRKRLGKLVRLYSGIDMRIDELAPQLARHRQKDFLQKCRIGPPAVLREVVVIGRQYRILLALRIVEAAFDIGFYGRRHPTHHKIAPKPQRQFLVQRLRHVVANGIPANEVDKPRLARRQEKFIEVKRSEIHVFNPAYRHRERLVGILRRGREHELQKRSCRNHMKPRTFLVEISKRFEHIRLRRLQFIKEKKRLTILYGHGKPRIQKFANDVRVFRLEKLDK